MAKEFRPHRNGRKRGSKRINANTGCKPNGEVSGGYAPKGGPLAPYS